MLRGVFAVLALVCFAASIVVYVRNRDQPGGDWMLVAGPLAVAGVLLGSVAYVLGII